jgi:putative endonuclease
MQRFYFVYILANRRNGTLYVGLTSDLARRVFEHQQGAIPGFTKKYGVKLLVYFEQHEEIGAAIARENAMKKWRRAWKLELIERDNPQWRDLAQDFLG